MPNLELLQDGRRLLNFEFFIQFCDLKFRKVIILANQYNFILYSGLCPCIPKRDIKDDHAFCKPLAKDVCSSCKA